MTSEGKAAERETHWRSLANERMAEIIRAREIIERLSGSKERLWIAPNAMVTNETMVEEAHKKSGNPYFNKALEGARATLDAEAYRTASPSTQEG